MCRSTQISYPPFIIILSSCCKLLNPHLSPVIISSSTLYSICSSSLHLLNPPKPPFGRDLGSLSLTISLRWVVVTFMVLCFQLFWQSQRLLPPLSPTSLPHHSLNPSLSSAILSRLGSDNTSDMDLTKATSRQCDIGHCPKQPSSLFINWVRLVGTVDPTIAGLGLD